MSGCDTSPRRAPRHKTGVDGKSGTPGVKFAYAGTEESGTYWITAINNAVAELQRKTKKIELKGDESI